MRITGTTPYRFVDDPIADFVAERVGSTSADLARAIGELTEAMCRYGLRPEDIAKITGVEIQDPQFNDEVGLSRNALSCARLLEEALLQLRAGHTASAEESITQALIVLSRDCDEATPT